MATRYKKGDSDTRPWGCWEVLDAASSYCVKKITVNAGGTLSLQLHNHRAEHWIMVEGEGIVTLGEEQMPKKADEVVYIPVQTKHRIENRSANKLVFIEVQTGQDLDEDDIVRFEDKYGRV